MIIVSKKELAESYIRSIKTLRKQHHLTQRETAEKIGMNVRTLQNWEQGIRHPPAWVAASALKRLESAL